MGQGTGVTCPSRLIRSNCWLLILPIEVIAQALCTRHNFCSCASCVYTCRQTCIPPHCAGRLHPSERGNRCITKAESEEDASITKVAEKPLSKQVWQLALFPYIINVESLAGPIHSMVSDHQGGQNLRLAREQTDILPNLKLDPAG